ncbi:hypothetical protein Syun_026068 [Stephania yunnanensis]|uniref:Uncharacterized protein n=1 Tax=Stephania yunnanensis TaxID=152371 RepID=A0AAP0EZX1_9MAGN
MIARGGSQGEAFESSKGSLGNEEIEEDVYLVDVPPSLRNYHQSSMDSFSPSTSFLSSKFETFSQISDLSYRNKSVCHGPPIPRLITKSHNIIVSVRGYQNYSNGLDHDPPRLRQLAIVTCHDVVGGGLLCVAGC